MLSNIFNENAHLLMDALKKEEREFIQIRHHLHANPELSRQEFSTADYIEELLQSWGLATKRYDNTGVVASLSKGSSSAHIALRADIDALPIHEESPLPYSSKREGVMHACGHDGHTTMLLMAAKYLSQAEFDGTITFIFQPDEEDQAGAKRLVEAGLFEDFPAEYVFAMHNFPGAPAGTFLIKDGPQMAGTCTIEIDILGKGGHAAHPYQTVDTVLVSAHIITALQSIVSRNLSALDSAVITIGSIHGGSANNVIPNRVKLLGTLRYFDIEIRDQIKERIREIVTLTAQSFGAESEIKLTDGYIPTINDDEPTQIALEVAQKLFKPEQIRTDKIPSMGAEDFGFMLSACKGAYFYIGNDEPSEPLRALHTDQYDFNDKNLIPGAAMWIELAQTYLRKRLQ